MATGTPGLISDNARQQLMALARYMAQVPGAPRPANLADAQDALRHGNTFEWFNSLFQTFAGPNLTVHWYSPHRLAGVLKDSVVALAIGPSDRSQEDATQFFRIHNGLLEEAEQINDTETLFRRLAITLSWDSKDQLTPHINGWRNAILDALRDDLRRRISGQQPHIRLLVDDGIEQPWPTSDSLILAYLALGLNPAVAIADAIKDISLPMPARDE